MRARGVRTPVRAELAQAIRRRRVARGWTRADLARRAGTYRSRVEAIEMQRGDGTGEELLAIARALGCQHNCERGPAASRTA